MHNVYMSSGVTPKINGVRRHGMYMYHIHIRYTYTIYRYHIQVPYTGTIYMYHIHVPYTYHVHVPYTCAICMHHMHAPYTCTIYMHHVHVPCTCTMYHVPCTMYMIPCAYTIYIKYEEKYMLDPFSYIRYDDKMLSRELFLTVPELQVD